MSTGTWAATDLCSESDVTKWETEVLSLISNASNDYLATAVNIATATDPIVTGVTSVDVENGIGVLEIIGVAKTELTIKDGKSLTIKIYDSADDSTFAEIHTGQRVYYNAPSGSDATISATTELFRWVVPSDCEDYIKAIISSDATNSGTIDIYTNSVLQNFIDLAKEDIGVDLSRMLMNVDLDANLNYSDGDILLDVIDNPEIFKLSAVFKTLEIFYQNLTSGNENSPFYKKQLMYHDMYVKQIDKEWPLKNVDVNLDSTVDEYKEETPVAPTFSRSGR